MSLKKEDSLMQRSVTLKQKIDLEVKMCADSILRELTGGKVRPEAWRVWFLCEKHGGAPVIARNLPSGQVAFWDGEDIVVDGAASLKDVIAALPEELTHRLGYASERFETLNYELQHSQRLPRTELQELVGQRVASLYEAKRMENEHE